MDKDFKKVTDLCDYLTQAWRPESLRWGWGEALFCYALAELDDFIKEDRYFPFIKGYCDKFVRSEPVVDASDTAAPALATYYAYKKTGNESYKKLTDLSLEYIRTVPKILNDEIPNHFGFSKDAKDYPPSVWVDSLMMFSVFPARYGKEQGDLALLDYAARLPKTFADCLMDEESGLFYHSYRVNEQRHYPYRKIFWGRGNGWVATALPMILERIGKENPHYDEIAEIFRKNIDGILRYQRADGSFSTVLNKPKRTYRELSATALVACGLFAGIRLGLLSDEEYRPQAEKAYRAVSDRVYYKDGGVFMPEISRPTVPMAHIPYLWYKFLPRGNNWNYGVAAFVFAAIEKEKADEFSITSKK